jgi:hypothetical protein
MKGFKSPREHRALLAEFGRACAEQQGLDPTDFSVDWAAFGAACRQAVAKGHDVPAVATFIPELAVVRGRDGAPDGEGDVPEGRPVSLVVNPLLDSLRSEFNECRRRVSHYSRLSTELELRLEQIDREQQKAYRQAQELAQAIETEESEQLRRETVATAGRPGARLQRHRAILAVMGRHPTADITPAALSAALQYVPSYVHELLKELVDEGLVQRVAVGVYRLA